MNTSEEIIKALDETEELTIEMIEIIEEIQDYLSMTKRFIKSISPKLEIIHKKLILQINNSILEIDPQIILKYLN